MPYFSTVVVQVKISAHGFRKTTISAVRGTMFLQMVMYVIYWARIIENSTRFYDCWCLVVSWRPTTRSSKPLKSIHRDSSGIIQKGSGAGIESPLRWPEVSRILAVNPFQLCLCSSVVRLKLRYRESAPTVTENHGIGVEFKAPGCLCESKVLALWAPAFRLGHLAAITGTHPR